MTLVSIIIPCFNRARLISSAIESALDQSYPDIEVIMIDDYSTDDSWRVISSFGERIKAIRNEKNGGVSRARNIGVRQARGTLVKFLDSDDLLEPTVIERQLEDLARLPEISIPVGTGCSIGAEPNSPWAMSSGGCCSPSAAGCSRWVRVTGMGSPLGSE